MILVRRGAAGPLELGDARRELFPATPVAARRFQDAGRLEIGNELEFVGGETGEKPSCPGLCTAIGACGKGGNQILA